ncbi:MAG TPA: hypothetical protein VFR07_06335 [Mycobacteriales bacterium]|jgi:hypothetical protein|nr:hypothetical protein [Mycobacteriales bacterium]
MDGSQPLAIYVNDHLMGASAGLELFRRAAGNHRGTPLGDALERLTAEVERDREALLATARDLGVTVRRYKLLAGWAAEKAGRLKPNGHLVTRAPLSDLVELEGLRLGVQGKEAGWLSLRQVAGRYPALDPAELDRLVARARDQAAELEALRQQCAAAVLTP